jgi:branched-chain amino acid transport protein azlD
MQLSTLEVLMILFALVSGTLLTRWLAFALFPENRRQPQVISFLSLTIPAAMMGLLVVFCLKRINVLTYPYGLPELISVSLIVILHLWRRNVLLSIAAGTLMYMFLVQKIFI